MDRSKLFLNQLQMWVSAIWAILGLGFVFSVMAIIGTYAFCWINTAVMCSWIEIIDTVPQMKF